MRSRKWILAALGVWLATAGCGGGKQTENERLLADFKEISDTLCACKGVSCRDDFLSSIRAFKRRAPRKPPPEIRRRAERLSKNIARCMRRHVKASARTTTPGSLEGEASVADLSPWPLSAEAKTARPQRRDAARSPALLDGGVPGDAPPPPCTSREQRQFDFWVGKWEVKGAKGRLAGHNTITRIHRDCALHESWRSARGGTGSSLNYYNRVDKQWHQLWVDGTGGVIELAGGLQGKAMFLSGTYTQADGTRTLLRGTWTPLDDGRVRQWFEQSKDKGKRWTTWFDGYYSRAK